MTEYNRTEEMLSYVPGYYRESKFYTAQNSAKGEEFNLLRFLIDNLLNQFHVQDATWGLKLWEEMLDLKTDFHKSDIVRRERILAKLQAQQVSVRSIISRFVEGLIDIKGYPELYEFYIRVGWNKVKDLDSLIEAFEEARPAHVRIVVAGIPDRMMRLNAAGSIQTVIQDFTWKETIDNKLFGGTRFNCPAIKLNSQSKNNDGKSIYQQQIITHPDVRTHKKFKPDVGMLLNSKPSLGYKWKTNLKEGS